MGPAEQASRSVGFWVAVSLVVGNMIGAGVFLLPASLAPFGGLSLAGWLVSAAGATLLALVFARLARMHPSAGGPYAYTRMGFGNLAAFLVGWGYWVSCWTTNAALAIAFVGALDPFIPSIVRSPPAAAALAIAAVWVLSVVNIAGVRAAGQVQLVTTILKLAPLVIVGVAGCLALDRSHFAIADTTTRGLSSGIGSAATLSLFAFLGLECATIPANSIRDPARTIPRATIAGTLAASVIFIVSTIGVMSLIAPDALSHSTAPFADAARVLFGSRFAAAVALGAAISAMGALNGWILITAEIPMAMAADGLFPSIFGRTSPRGTPVAGIVIAGLLATGLIGLNYTRQLVNLFTFIILLATLSTLVPYVFCALASLRLPDTSAPARGRSRIFSGSGLIALGALAFSLWAIAGAGLEVIVWGLALLAAGVIVYLPLAAKLPSRPRAQPTP